MRKILVVVELAGTELDDRALEMAGQLPHGLLNPGGLGFTRIAGRRAGRRVDVSGLRGRLGSGRFRRRFLLLSPWSLGCSFALQLLEFPHFVLNS